MVTKAIINSPVSGAQVNISIPILSVSSIDAHILSYPGFLPNFSVGQVVYVSFINEDSRRPVVIGSLQTGNSTGRRFDASVNSIGVKTSANIGDGISFGSDISYSNLANIRNLSDDIQTLLENALNYIDILNGKIDDISNRNNGCSSNISSAKEEINSLSAEVSELSSLLGDIKDSTEDTIYGKINLLEQHASSLREKVGDFEEGAKFTEKIEELKDLIENANNSYSEADGDEVTPSEQPTSVEGLLTSQQGINFLKFHEGFSATIYSDYGNNSYGYGTSYNKQSRDKRVTYPEPPITEAQADILLKEVLKYQYEPTVENINKKRSKKMKQWEFDAMVSFYYNTGNLTPGYNMYEIAMGNITDKNTIYNTFLAWANPESLTQRRIDEYNLFVNGKYS